VDDKFDGKELTERAEAASAYGDEDPDLYVDYCHSCIKQSEDATSDIRYMWDQCYKAYRSKIDYPMKQDWQSKVITGDMFTAVKQAIAVVRASFRQPNWFSIENRHNPQLAKVINDMLDIWLDAQHANLPIVFSDASELAFAIGQSHEIIPRWEDGKGLVFDLIPPWQIYRDPDAVPRDPWSGDYWIHIEWFDTWKLTELFKTGNYVRLDEVRPDEGSGGSRETKEKKARRKGQFYQRSPYRKSVRVVEQWGVILDKQGDLLLPNARFTVAGDVLIRNPEPNPYETLRWPGISFSPLPDMIGFEGHGILESAILLWLMTCNLMSLHIDDLNWRVNRMRQLNRFLLEDPSDVSMYPGKLLLTEKGVTGPVISDVYTPGDTSEILAILQHFDQRRENSTFVNQFVAGLPGQRSHITKGEVEIKTQQSMTIFDSIGEDVENGLIQVLRAAIETLVLNWSEYSYPPVSRVMPDPMAMQFAALPIEQRKELLRANCDIKAQGITAQFKNSEMLPRLQFLMSQIANSAFARYLKPYQLLTQIVNTLGFYEPEFMANEEEAKQADAYAAQMAQTQEQMQEMQQMAQTRS